jgi:general secretion pathway protein C
MPARLSAFVIWAAVAASAVFWLLRMLVTPPRAPVQTVAVSTSASLRGDVSRLLGAPPAAAPAAAAVVDQAGRFRLVGVMAPKGDATVSGQGIALIAIDGKPARPYRIGGTVEGDLVLQTVSQRGALIGQRSAEPSVRLELPPLPPPSTGTLPAPPAFNAGAAPVVAPPAPAPPPGATVPGNALATGGGIAPADGAPPPQEIPPVAR